MNDMSHQGNFLPNFDDPNSLMSYYINDNEGNCQTLVSTPLQNSNLATSSQVIQAPNTNMSEHQQHHHQNLFHHSSQQQMQIRGQYQRPTPPPARPSPPTQPSHSMIPSSRHDNLANSSLVSGYLQSPPHPSPLHTDPLPQFSMLQGQNRNTHIYNSNNLMMMCNSNRTNDSNSMLFDKHVQSNYGHMSGPHGISTNATSKELNSSANPQVNALMTGVSLPKSRIEINNSSNSINQPKRPVINSNFNQLPNMSSLPLNSSSNLNSIMSSSSNGNSKQHQINDHIHGYNSTSLYDCSTNSMCNSRPYFSDQSSNQQNSNQQSATNDNISYSSLQPMTSITEDVHQQKDEKSASSFFSPTISPRNCLELSPAVKEKTCAEVKIDPETDKKVVQNDVPVQTCQSLKRKKKKKKMLAQVKTITSFKVIEQVILDGKVVQEKVIKNEEFDHISGFTYWPADATENLISETSSEKLNFSPTPSSRQGTPTQIAPKDQSLSNETPVEDKSNSFQLAANKPKKKKISAAESNLPIEKKKADINFGCEKRSISNCFEVYDDFHFKPIGISSRVLAKWSDKNFYAGKVADKVGENKWLVQFDDGGRRTMSDYEIISVDHLPVGQQVMVTFASGFCVRGRVKSWQFKSHRLADESVQEELFYLIEHLTNSQVAESEYRASDVFLNLENGLLLLGKRKIPTNASKFADVDLNNIIPKRARVANKNLNSQGNSSNDVEKNLKATSSQVSVDFDLDSNSSSCASNAMSTHSAGTKSKKRDRSKLGANSKQPASKSSATQEDFSGFSSDTIILENGCNNMNLKQKENSQPTLFNCAEQSNSISNISLNAAGVTSTVNHSDFCSNDEMSIATFAPETPLSVSPETTTRVGGVGNCITEPSTPISTFDSCDGKDLLEFEKPVFNSKLFFGLSVIVLNTSATEKSAPSEYAQLPGHEIDKNVRFDRQILVRLLESGSGMVFESVEDALAQVSSFCKRVVACSHSYSRDVKYLQCLAAGIDCLSYLWVYDCIKSNHLVDFDNHFLPTGFSLLENRLILDGSIFRKNPDLFRGFRVYLASKNAKFVETWKPLLSSANVILTDSLPQYAGSSTRKLTNCTDLIVSDHNCSSSVLKKSSLLKIPIVSIEYIVQCLVHGRKLPFDGHFKFFYNHKDK